MNNPGVYQSCPILEISRFTCCLVDLRDAADLLQVYSDSKAVPLFNSDNCYGDDFHYQTLARMTSAIQYWLEAYVQKQFVRWSIIDRRANIAVGTVEIFDRVANDKFDDTAILRLDLRHDYEKSADIIEIITPFLEMIPTYFNSTQVATKIAPIGQERILAFQQMGFQLANEKLIGHDGTEYGDYYLNQK